MKAVFKKVATVMVAAAYFTGFGMVSQAFADGDHGHGGGDDHGHGHGGGDDHGHGHGGGDDHGHGHGHGH